MKCKHENTRKLFWSNNSPNRWERTNVSLCLDCGMIVGMQPVEMGKKNLTPTLPERTKKVMSDDAFSEKVAGERN